MTTTPSLRRTMPQNATPMPTSCSSEAVVVVERAKPARERGKVGDRLRRCDACARTVDARRAQDLAAKADDGRGEVVDSDLEREHDGAI